MVRRSLLSISPLLLLAHCNAHTSAPSDDAITDVSISHCAGPRPEYCLESCSSDALIRADVSCVDDAWSCPAGLILESACKGGCIPVGSCCDACGRYFKVACNRPFTCGPDGFLCSGDPSDVDAACLDAGASLDAADASDD